MCGDSTNIDQVTKLLEKNRCKLMVTDPPYGVEYDANWRNEVYRKGGLKRFGATAIGKVDNDDRIDWSPAFALFPGDVAYVWHAGKYASTVQQSIESCKFEIRAQIIWVKTHFILSRGNYHWQHEPCWYAVREGKVARWAGGRKQSTTWQIENLNPFGGTSKEEKTGHSTQKPVECMARPIRNHTIKGEWVYDPFGGSGSTLIAAESLGRFCAMMELSPIYCQVVVNRWEKATGKKAKLL